MTAEQLQKIEENFNIYTKSFFSDDEYINSSLQMKLGHSKRVKAESEYIARALELDENDINIAIVIGLLHDIARFPQFVKYQTYCDPRSVNHSQWGAEILQKINILKALPSEEQEIIIAAVKYHGIKEIPAGLDKKKLLHAQIIRDSDKIDIFEVVLDGYRILRDEPEKFPLEIEYSMADEYSPEIYNAAISGRTIDYNLAKTMHDNRLLQAAWVFDMNFKPTLRRLAERKYIEQLFEFLPDDEKIAKLRDYILNCINVRLNS